MPQAGALFDDSADSSTVSVKPKKKRFSFVRRLFRRKKRTNVPDETTELAVGLTESEDVASVQGRPDDTTESPFGPTDNDSEYVASVVTASETLGPSVVDVREHAEDGGSAATAPDENKSPPSLYSQSLAPFRVDFVQSFANAHAFINSTESSQTDQRKLYKELVDFQKNLPLSPSSSIFVRVLESRVDLVRAMITGPEDTPYANGCFFFDIYTRGYPAKPPKVQFLTTGNGRVRFNPNLYASGKVCLSLLGTWSGPGWQSRRSTLLQVLVSLQGMVLVSHPYFNEPGCVLKKGCDINTHAESNRYNKSTRRETLSTAMIPYLRAAVQGTEFVEYQEVLKLHFIHRAESIKNQLEVWVQEDTSLQYLSDTVKTLLDELTIKPDKPSSDDVKSPPSELDCVSV